MLTCFKFVRAEFIILYNICDDDVLSIVPLCCEFEVPLLISPFFEFWDFFSNTEILLLFILIFMIIIIILLSRSSSTYG